MMTMQRADTQALKGLKRSIFLVKMFGYEQSDPDRFYKAQAIDTAHQMESFRALAGQFVVDVGGGAGYFSAEFEARGARCLLIEPGAESLGVAPEGTSKHDLAVWSGRLLPTRTLNADGSRAPLGDAVADVVFTSNVYEHVAEPEAFLNELMRLLKPGGLLYFSYTLWLSPWGGHETSPWHYLGGNYAAKRFARRQGKLPKNLFGTSLFARHAGKTLRQLRSRDDIVITKVLPRYYPAWMAWIVHVPLLREFLTWNLLVIAERA